MDATREADTRERLTFLAKFAGQDLGSLREGALLDLKQDAATFASVASAFAEAGQALAPAIDAVGRAFADLSVPLLQILQGIVGTGLEAVADKVAWTPPVEVGRVVVTPGEGLHVTPARAGIHDAFVLETARSLAAGGELLRRCARVGCERPFVRWRKQVFCSLSCAQKARDARRRQKDSSGATTVVAPEKAAENAPLALEPWQVSALRLGTLKRSVSPTKKTTKPPTKKSAKKTATASATRRH